MNDIRPLRESDKDDILEIARHTWEGHDYIPYYFDTWLKDKNSYPVGVEYDGHIIALANLRVIDDGKTGWMEALRVHPNHRGKGLATSLTQYVVQLAKSIPVKCIRYTTSVGNETSLHLAEVVGMKRKFDLAVHWQENPSEISWRMRGFPLLEVSADEVCQDLIDANLIPFNILIHDWKAFDVTPKGLNKIGSTARFWVQTRAGKLTSFSLGFARDVSSGMQWSFTIYASDRTGFLDHLSYHIDIASKSGCTSIFVAFETDYVETMHNLDWVQLDENEDEEWALTLLERML
ncbi:MAG: GNAT family N-acetyltransferase [Candidatus Thorarchaeota archaeon]|nr:GNAT family N-acetyltransferase [Candidatus Thorarchaeota archaeon]